jgi:general secretion pathway protein B
MSFILDALKKSEIERQRQSVPGLMDSGPVQKRARFPVWAIALAALLAVNLAVLIIVLAHGGMPSLSGRHADEPIAAAPRGASPDAAAPPGGPSTAALTAPRPTAGHSAAQEPAPAQHHFSPMDAAPPVYAPEIPADSEAAPQAAATRGAPTSGAALSSNRGAPAEASADRASGRDPLLTGGVDKSDQEVLPLISELNLTGADALPDLHIDVHVYATKPAERFVYINMRKYREGDTLAEGPVLEHIRRDGVVLDYHGLRFVLPRQQ